MITACVVIHGISNKVEIYVKGRRDIATRSTQTGTAQTK